MKGEISPRVIPGRCHRVRAERGPTTGSASNPESIEQHRKHRRWMNGFRARRLRGARNGGVNLLKPGIRRPFDGWQSAPTRDNRANARPYRKSGVQRTRCQLARPPRSSLHSRMATCREPAMRALIITHARPLILPTLLAPSAFVLVEKPSHCAPSGS